jgi:hypothetical protein
MDVQIADDLRAQAMAAVAAFIHRDQPGFDAVVGTDEEAAVLLPVVIGELVTALERLAGPDEVHKQVDTWLNDRRQRLAS